MLSIMKSNLLQINKSKKATFETTKVAFSFALIFKYDHKKTTCNIVVMRYILQAASSFSAIKRN